jgi:hypothetical protein
MPNLTLTYIRLGIHVSASTQQLPDQALVSILSSTKQQTPPNLQQQVSPHQEYQVSRCRTACNAMEV